MEKIFEYQGLYYINEEEIDGLKVINNKLYYKDYCWKCGGTGHISYYDWYADGVCFECNGTGFKYRPLTTYKTLKGAERAIQREIQKSKEHEKQIELKKKEIIKKYKTIYVVNPLKEDTKKMKQYLKDIGCVWSGKVWYKNNLDEFNNIQTIKLNMEKELKEKAFILAGMNSIKSKLFYISDIINDKIQPKLDKLNKIIFNTDYKDYKLNNKYEFNIKEVLSKHCYESRWGACYYYILLDNKKHKLKYKTARNLDINGKYIATVKDKENGILTITRLTEIK